jgi:hypothetical protein
MVGATFAQDTRDVCLKDLGWAMFRVRKGASMALCREIRARKAYVVRLKMPAGYRSMRTSIRPTSTSGHLGHVRAGMGDKLTRPRP